MRVALDHVRDLLAGEAAQRVRDVEFLTGRILAAVEPLVSAKTEQMLDLLKQAATTDPNVAELLNKVGGVRQAVHGVTVGSESSGLQEDQPVQELRLHTEEFYYTAHRLTTCMSLLPGLKGLECREVAIVRNQLLEHPEKPASGVLLPSFSYDAERGPVIKGIRYSEQAEVHPDDGFIPNCRALIRTLEDALRRAVQDLPPPTSPATPPETAADAIG